MAKWKINQEMKFFLKREGKEFIYTILEKNEIYDEVPSSLWGKSISKTVSICQKEADHTVRFIVIDAKGKHRVAEIGKDVVPYSKKLQRKMRIK